MPGFDWPLGPVAHRGLHDSANGIIENTISAAEAAIAKGFAIELDLQPALNGEPVVFHDESLDRLTGVNGPVAAHSAADLAMIPIHGTSDRIITFADYLRRVAARVPLVVEVKSEAMRVPAFEAEIARLVAQYDGKLALMSFEPGIVRAFAGLAPNRPRGLLSGTYEDRSWLPHLGAVQRWSRENLLPALHCRPDFIAYEIGELPKAAPLLLRRLGLPLLTWTVRSNADRARAEKYADAMIFEGFVP